MVFIQQTSQRTTIYSKRCVCLLLTVRKGLGKLIATSPLGPSSPGAGAGEACLGNQPVRKSSSAVLKMHSYLLAEGEKQRAARADPWAWRVRAAWLRET